VLPCGFDEVQFHGHVTLVVGQPCGEQVGIAAKCFSVLPLLWRSKPSP
jgi:hypothetical protein